LYRGNLADTANRPASGTKTGSSSVSSAAICAVNPGIEGTAQIAAKICSKGFDVRLGHSGRSKLAPIIVRGLKQARAWENDGVLKKGRFAFFHADMHEESQCIS
jgi:hypothetical protein